MHGIRVTEEVMTSSCRSWRDSLLGYSMGGLQVLFSLEKELASGVQPLSGSCVGVWASVM